MRCRLSPTAEVSSHTFEAAMGPLADSCGRMASMAAPSCALAWFRLSPEVLLIRDRRNVQFASLLMGQKATLVSTPTRGPSTLERRPQSRIERAWPRRAERTRIYEFRAAIGEIGQGLPVEEGADSRIAVVEDVVDATVDLEDLVDLVGGMEIEHGVGRQLWKLVGLVADEILARNKQRV